MDIAENWLLLIKLFWVVGACALCPSLRGISNNFADNTTNKTSNCFQQSIAAFKSPTNNIIGHLENFVSFLLMLPCNYATRQNWAS